MFKKNIGKRKKNQKSKILTVRLNEEEVKMLKAAKELIKQSKEGSVLKTFFKLAYQNTPFLIEEIEKIKEKNNLNNDRRRNPSYYKRFKEKYCRICNISDKKTILQIHHIDEDPLNNNVNNLLTVCQKCHVKIHKGKRGVKKGTLGLNIYIDEG